jgi:hypothetical protein
MFLDEVVYVHTKKGVVELEMMLLPKGFEGGGQAS